MSTLYVNTTGHLRRYGSVILDEARLINAVRCVTAQFAVAGCALLVLTSS